MNKHAPLIIGIIIALAIVAFFVLQGGGPLSPTGPTTSTPTEQVEPPPSLDRGPSVTGTGGALPNQTPQAVVEEGETPTEIIYTSAGYAPKELEITKGTVVVFKNLSSVHMWPASAVHPTHDVYPTIGGCLGSTFDACAGIRANNTWSFRFEIPGTWHYHDHITPSNTATIVVR